jgi:hypothetical protein
MQWSVADLLYRVPSGAIIRQAIAGKVEIPKKGTLHAVYENQMYRQQEKKAEKAQQKTAPTDQAQMGVQISSAQGSNGSSPAANGQSMAMAAPESQSSAMDGNQMAANAPAMNSSMTQPAASNPAMAPAPDTAPQPDFPPFSSIEALAPHERVAQLQQMQPAEFDAFMHSLKGQQRNQLSADMSPDLREALEDLENPQRMEAEELMAERLTRDIYSNAQ